MTLMRESICDAISLMSTQRLTNEVLGYSPDARLLIINCDDFGMCFSQNAGTIQSIETGIASSCSLMMPPAWGVHAAQFLQENNEVNFAVHLTALSEYTCYKWGPLMPVDEVPTLVNEDGHFLADDEFDEIIRSAECRELETEFRSQIEVVFGFGLHPTHLDSHYGLHTSRPDIFDLTVRLAHEYGLALRVTGKDNIETAREFGFPTVDHPVLDSGSLVPTEICSYLERLMRVLPVGLSEWALHPGVNTDEIRAIMATPKAPGMSGTPEQRQADLDFLTSEKTAALVKEEGIQIISYRELQPFWQS
ncbi:MAG: ChbG/HpnK family deacetylase [Anaerolineales bacterium]|nr:ChbG/HpnK family deacetylase [Anaerolineales bacterium]